MNPDKRKTFISALCFFKKPPGKHLKGKTKFATQTMFDVPLTINTVVFGSALSILTYNTIKNKKRDCITILQKSNTVLWSVFFLIVCLGIYIYLFYKYKIVIDEESNLSLTSVQLESSLQSLFNKWKAIGSPDYIKQDANIVNLFYFLLPWRDYDYTSYTNCLTNIDSLIEYSSQNRSLSTRNAKRQTAIGLLNSYKDLDSTSYTMVLERLSNLTIRYNQS